MAIRWIPSRAQLKVHYDGQTADPVRLFHPPKAWAYAAIPVSYLRAIHHPGKPMEIRIDGLAIEDSCVESLYPVADYEHTADRIRFRCTRPGDYVVRINRAFALFLFLDPGDFVPARIAGRQVITAGKLLEAATDTERTVTLQGILDAASRVAGGAIVRLPEGSFTVGTIEMRSGVHLHVPDGSTLQGSPDRSLYPADPPAKGLSIGRCRLIHFFEVRDSGIFGRGAIDGNGFLMRHEALLEGKRAKRVASNLVRINRSTDIHIEGVLLRDSEFWNTHILDSEKVRLRDIKIINEIPPRHWDPDNPGFFWNNADGVNPDATHDMEVDGLFAYCGDDCLPVKNTGNARDPQRPTSRIAFRRCTLISETTVTKIGTETCSPAIRDIRFENLLLLDGGSPFGIIVRDGAEVAHVVIRGMRALRMNGPIYLHTQPRTSGQGHPAGRIRDLLFEDCSIGHAKACNAPPLDIVLQREDDLQDVRFQTVVVDGETIAPQAIPH